MRVGAIIDSNCPRRTPCVEEMVNNYTITYSIFVSNFQQRQRRIIGLKSFATISEFLIIKILNVFVAEFVGTITTIPHIISHG